MDFDSDPNDLPTDAELIANALDMWGNYIETKTLTMTAKDAMKAKRPFNALDEQQMALVLRLRVLAKTIHKRIR